MAFFTRHFSVVLRGRGGALLVGVSVLVDGGVGRAGGGFGGAALIGPLSFSALVTDAMRCWAQCGPARVGIMQ